MLPMDEILTVKEVAKYLKISPAKLYYMINRRQIPYIRLDRNVRIRKSDLMLWLNGQVVDVGGVWMTAGWKK